MDFCLARHGTTQFTGPVLAGAGRVFDVTSTGEVIVPITAKLRVGDASLFAVIVERPGGVVVSRREHIIVTAGS